MTDRPYPLSLSELIANRARQSPEATAILAPGRAPLSYARLQAQVEETVTALNAMDLGRNDRIALVLPNGPEMAVAFVAVAATTTCAPLNPAYRAEEFDFYISDLGAKAIMIQAGFDFPIREVAKRRGLRTIEVTPLLNAEAGTFSLSGEHGPKPTQTGFAEPDDVALVLHTSGTTSRPKIVPLRQSNICASAQNIQQTLKLSERDRCLNVMPLFHIHGLIGATLSTLAAGGTVICTPGFYTPKFFEWMEEFGPTWYTAVPTMHQAILERAESHRSSIQHISLRFIRSSSAALPPRVMTALEETFRAPVIESYGMTEASHQMTSNLLPPGLRKPGSVGVAAGPEVAVMDEAGRLLDPGETGEIVIRGPNVMLGYENNPEANEQAFTQGWFRTGDQGYHDPDGHLFITGRLKEIINRGGEKISPREIDDILMEHPAIAQAVCFAIPDGKLGEDVGAAVVLKANREATDREIRDFAARRLTDFKVPRQVLIVQEIPQGPTGKPQRIGLAEKLGLSPDDQERDRQNAFIAPRNPIEQALADILAEILGVEPIGVRDDFLALGGDSVLATQFVSRVRPILQVDLSIIDIFDTPTIEGLAELIQGISSQATSLPALEPASRDQPLPLSWAQERLWFLEQYEPGTAAMNRPAHLRLTGRLNQWALERSLTEIIRRHEILRTSIGLHAGSPVQTISPPREISLPLVDLSELPLMEREPISRRLAREETGRPFKIESESLMRFILVRLTESEHVLLITFHHIVFDGWSMGVFLRELEAFYNRFASGRSVSLPPLPIQFADFAIWQRQWLQGDLLARLLAYWRQKLGDSPSPLSLPTDRPRPAIRTFRGAAEGFDLPVSLTTAIEALSREEGVSLFMTLLAAFKALLHRYTGQTDISVGTFTAIRDHRETEGLIGFFVNNLVLRTDLTGNPRFRELLQRVRDVTLGAYLHQDLPFEKLLEEIQPVREPNQTPFFHVMFVLQNAPQPKFNLSGLHAEILPLETTRANFDLTMWMSRAEERLTGTLEYQTDLFEASTIRQIVERFRTLLEHVTADPDGRLLEIPVGENFRQGTVSPLPLTDEFIFNH